MSDLVCHDACIMDVFLEKANSLLAGEHPRIGAMDVCPFIPVKNVTMEDCINCAKEFGERLSIELGVPGSVIK